MLSERIRSRSNSAIYLGGHHVLGATIFGEPIIIDSSDFQSLKLFYLPTPNTIAIFSFLCHFIKHGMKCADIGAGCGYYSLILGSLVGNKGSVHSFESNEERFTLLKRNVIANDFHWIHCQQAIENNSISELNFLHISLDEELLTNFVNVQSIIHRSANICLICHIDSPLMRERSIEFDTLCNELDSLKFEGYLFPSFTPLESKEQLLHGDTVKTILLCRGAAISEGFRDD